MRTLISTEVRKTICFTLLGNTSVISNDSVVFQYKHICWASSSASNKNLGWHPLALNFNSFFTKASLWFQGGCFSRWKSYFLFWNVWQKWHYEEQKNQFLQFRTLRIWDRFLEHMKTENYFNLFHSGERFFQIFF